MKETTAVNSQQISSPNKMNRPIYGGQCGGVGARDNVGAVGVGLRAGAGEGSGIGCAVSGTDETTVLSGLAGCLVQPTCCIQLVIICLLSGDQPSSGAFVAITCLVVSP